MPMVILNTLMIGKLAELIKEGAPPEAPSFFWGKS